MIPDVTQVGVEQLLTVVQGLAEEGCRLVSITGVDAGDAFELLYHFDRELRLTHLRVRLPKGQELPSISRIYFCAFVPENELQDFFGIRVANPVIDYGGHMLLARESPETPLVKRERPEGAER
ncbi:MAG: NADH-quinone oxidoreductase subunit C [Bacillota bacterium]|nr:NADH-quinone oxidoreductase subunit C [Bacillota bacterium]